jgi:hypothetical protein
MCPGVAWQRRLVRRMLGGRESLGGNLVKV